MHFYHSVSYYVADSTVSVLCVRCSSASRKVLPCVIDKVYVILVSWQPVSSDLRTLVVLLPLSLLQEPPFPPGASGVVVDDVVHPVINKARLDESLLHHTKTGTEGRAFPRGKFVIKLYPGCEHCWVRCHLELRLYVCVWINVCVTICELRRGSSTPLGPHLLNFLYSLTISLILFYISRINPFFALHVPFSYHSVTKLVFLHIFSNSHLI